MNKKRFLFALSLLIGTQLISNSLIDSNQISSNIYTLDFEDPDIKRKFNAHIIALRNDSFLVCWEQGTEEINNNTIICRLYNKDLSTFKPIYFNKPNPELRCFPVDLIEIKDSIYLYFMEMNTDVYMGTGISCLKRARLDTLNDSLIVQNYSIWETTQGSAMEFLTVGNQLLMPFYESKMLGDGLYHSIIGTLMLNQEGTKTIDSSSVITKL